MSEQHCGSIWISSHFKSLQCVSAMAGSWHTRDGDQPMMGIPGAQQWLSLDLVKYTVCDLMPNDPNQPFFVFVHVCFSSACVHSPRVYLAFSAHPSTSVHLCVSLYIALFDTLYLPVIAFGFSKLLITLFCKTKFP